MSKMIQQFMNKNLKKGNYKSFNAWLYSRWVLYFLFVLAIGNIYYLLVNYDYFTLTAFILVAFLTTFFSKNMVVILCISLVISTILKSVRLTEGLSTSEQATFNNVLEQLSGIVEGNVEEDDEAKKEKKENFNEGNTEKEEKAEKEDKEEVKKEEKKDKKEEKKDE
jgi:hypothetical protein